MFGKNYDEEMNLKKMKSNNFIIILIIIFCIGLVNAIPNATCNGDVCNLTYENNYSYENNLKDPKCWANINFCNLENSTLNLNVINTLKQVNYDQQGLLNGCQVRLEELYDKNRQDKISFWVLFFLVIICGLWSTYITMKWRQDENRNK